MDKISTPQARATIVWIVAEFCARNEYAGKLAPDVLRTIAKSFTNETDLVKLQALNLAAKLYLTRLEENADQPQDERLRLLINYVYNLAKYDLNYDVRDRGRFLRQLINDRQLAKQILLVPKLVPNVSQRAEPFIFSEVSANANSDQAATGGQPPSSMTKLASSVDSARFRVGTLSHFLGKKAAEYEELPDWPEEQPDPSVRKVKQAAPEPPQPTPKLVTTTQLGEKFVTRHKNGFLR